MLNMTGRPVHLHWRDGNASGKLPIGPSVHHRLNLPESDSLKVRVSYWSNSVRQAVRAQAFYDDLAAKCLGGFGAVALGALCYQRWLRPLTPVLTIPFASAAFAGGIYTLLRYANETRDDVCELRDGDRLPEREFRLAIHAKNDLALKCRLSQIQQPFIPVELHPPLAPLVADFAASIHYHPHPEDGA